MPTSCDQPALALQARPYVLRELPEGESVRFEDHLAGCPTCSARVHAFADALDRLEREATVRETATAWHGWIFARGGAAALAAAGVVVLLGYPAFLGLHRLPRVEGRIRDLERRQEEARSEYERSLTDLQARTRAEAEEEWRSAMLAALSGIRHLSRPARGGAAAADQVRLRADDRLVILGVELELVDIAEGGRYRFDIHRKDGPTVWSAELSGRSVHESLKTSGEILLPVPTSDLGAGDYELRVSGTVGSRSEDLVARRFTVVSSP